MEIFAKIKGIEYKPLLCRNLKEYSFNNLGHALSKDGTFILNIDSTNRIALSWWVSAKRTRSYPYARVYDSLMFSGKKVTIIPVYKDEGKDGDRDFLQWDTISLMSLLGIYVIIGYYEKASKNLSYDNKITSQIFDVAYIEDQIKKLLSYQSDSLHWNLAQIDQIDNIANKALKAYNSISEGTGVEMHSEASVENRILYLKGSAESFMNYSRQLARSAQLRESATQQPKENVDGSKSIITITNYLGGNYYFTTDEIKLSDYDLYLVEAKHTKSKNLPSLNDIKDGLIKMILFSNLSNVLVNEHRCNSIPVLKLTNNKTIFCSLSKSEEQTLKYLEKEAEINRFKISFNGCYLDNK